MTAWSRWIKAVAAATATIGVTACAPALAQVSQPLSAVPSGPLALVAEPQAGAGPFLAMIASAHRSIDLTMYELFDRQIEHALAAAAHRGVDVRVLLNGGYYSEQETTNRAAYRYLSADGVHVHYSPTYFALTHQKTLTVDDRESAILTLNFDDRYASTRDYAVIDRQPADVAAITAAFDADYAHQQLTPSTGTGDLVWSPGRGAATTVLNRSARRRARSTWRTRRWPTRPRPPHCAPRRGAASTSRS